MMIIKLPVFLSQCKKTGGLLGHRKDKLTVCVDQVLSQLSFDSVPKRVREMQALQLFSESLTSR